MHDDDDGIVLLTCFFGLGATAWVLVNALYAEIPLIVASLNYEYSVISKLTLCITLTSVAPIVYAVTTSSTKATTSTDDFCCCCGGGGMESKSVTKLGITIILALGTLTALGLSLSDAALQQTTLLVTSVCAGLVGTMANVLYYPHAATTTTAMTNIEGRGEEEKDDHEATLAAITFSPQQQPSSPPAVRQTTAMASGMAAASLFLAVLAIVQQQDKGDSNSRFSLRAYFGVVTAVFGMGILGFLGTLMADHKNNNKSATSSSNSEMVLPVANDKEVSSNSDKGNYGSIETSPSNKNINTDNLHRRKSTNVSNETVNSINVLDGMTRADARQQPNHTAAFEIQEEAPPMDEQDDEHHHNHDATCSSTSFFYSFLTISKRHATINAGQFLLNLLTFFLPGIVPYSIQHFGDSQRALHYLTVTQLIGQTLGALASGWKQNRSVWLQLLLFGVFWIPTVVLSFVNDTAFQRVSQLHSAVPITLNAVLNFGYGYSSTTFYHLVHAEATAMAETSSLSSSSSSSIDPHIASRVLGSWNQLGAMIGSLIAYLLVENGAIA